LTWLTEYPCVLRATHSRRIFVQQIGRGLRISPGKEKVIVLDFVTDIRRLAAVKELDKEAKADPKPGEVETVFLRNGVVTFSNEKAQKFVDAWLDDVASLQDQDDAESLAFSLTRRLGHEQNGSLMISLKRIKECVFQEVTELFISHVLGQTTAFPRANWLPCHCRRKSCPST
jgi:superfamily II DNA or RNA helicase